MQQLEGERFEEVGDENTHQKYSTRAPVHHICIYHHHKDLFSSKTNICSYVRCLNCWIKTEICNFLIVNTVMSCQILSINAPEFPFSI